MNERRFTINDQERRSAMLMRQVHHGANNQSRKAASEVVTGILALMDDAELGNGDDAVRLEGLAEIEKAVAFYRELLERWTP